MRGQLGFAGVAGAGCGVALGSGTTGCGAVLVTGATAGWAAEPVVGAGTAGWAADAGVGAAGTAAIGLIESTTLCGAALRPFTT